MRRWERRISCAFQRPASLADVAQLVEQLIRNQQVIGSSPIVGSIRLYLLEFTNLPKGLDTAKR